MNLFELMSKWNSFQNVLQQSRQDPQALLESELQRRGINKQQLREMIEQAKSLSYLFRTK